MEEEAAEALHRLPPMRRCSAQINTDEKDAHSHD